MTLKRYLKGYNLTWNTNANTPNEGLLNMIGKITEKPNLGFQYDVLDTSGDPPIKKIGNTQSNLVWSEIVPIIGYIENAVNTSITASGLPPNSNTEYLYNVSVDQIAVPLDIPPPGPVGWKWNGTEWAKRYFVYANGAFSGYEQNANNSLTEISVAPPQSSPNAEEWKWNGTEWVDGRTQEQIDAYNAAILADAKTAKIAEVWAECASRLENGMIPITVSAGTYNFGMDSGTQDNITKAVLGLLTGLQTFPRQWMPKGEIVPISITEIDLKTIAGNIGYTYDQMVQIYLGHKVQIMLKTTLEDVENYDYSVGWLI